MKITSSSSSLTCPNSITIEGTREDMDRIRGCLAGAVWLGCTDGKIEVSDRLKPAPDPVDDPFIPPKWQTEFGSLPDQFSPTLADHRSPDEGWHSPSFFVSHPFKHGAGNAHIRFLQDCGFECLRSRRGDEGHFWELWYLPFTSMAKGKLKDYLATLGIMTWDKASREVCEFVARNIVFGSMDVAVQRMALSYD